MDTEAKITEFTELEAQMRQLGRIELPTFLRGRVMKEVAHELALAESRSRRANNLLNLWPAIAAVVMIVLNLSFSSASLNEYTLHLARSPQSGFSELHALQTLEAQQEKLFK